MPNVALTGEPESNAWFGGMIYLPGLGPNRPVERAVSFLFVLDKLLILKHSRNHSEEPTLFAILLILNGH